MRPPPRLPFGFPARTRSHAPGDADHRRAARAGSGSST
jgi:hypothetical protein